ncbi:AMSH-like ubiquitin thioesterase 2 isoform X4 [Syzygium oleosum]|uniref:AMSH-like ubiquitin thioesterase 2 isoform X4 n=1 Tax=Syzygium oleosum TaxID=219896 RepID=UPI0011D19558|nr:AMSH-like ubiquitin thioesterase 2 isoform X4 [Syzygium oleosum]
MDPTYQRETAYKCHHVHVQPVTQSFPSPALSFIEDSTEERHLSRVKGAECDSTHSNSRKNLHISACLMEEFLELAKENTDKDLETCGILGAFLTHPSQSCFMSSIDLHTQYSYQVMVPEAFAIVVAPTDASRSYGMFRISEPGGMNVLRECRETGFHTHRETADGAPIYEHCANVYTNSNLRFEVFDLR